jgi:hypothetical protein
MAGHAEFVICEQSIEGDFAWATRFGRLVGDYERPPTTVAGLHFVGFACLFLHRVIFILGPSS